MVRLVLAASFALALGLATPPAQTARQLPPLVFDDLSYAAAEWDSQKDRPLAERSVFGLNPWCEGLACADTVVARTWYRYLWRENGFGNTDPLARFEPDTAATGTLGFALLAGDHTEQWPLQLASGFSSRTGVWAARADFSPLPEDEIATMQSFWLLGPNEALKTPDAGRYRGNKKGRVEVDFEFNNWFGEADGTDLYLATAYFDNSERGTALPLRAASDAGEYSCALTDRGGQTRTAEPEECARFLAADGVWATMLFRSDGEAIQFEVRAEGPAGVLRASSEVERGSAPSQVMMTMMSQYLVGTADAPNQGRLARDQRVVFDWVYWSPEADRSLADVRGDVAAIQATRVDGRRVTRLRTTPARLSRPYTDAPGQPLALRRTAPPQLRVSGPDTLDVLRRGRFSAQLDDIVDTFRIDWSRRSVARDGSVGEWSAPQTDDAYVHRTRMPLLAACIDVRARATSMIYTVVADGESRVAEWVPPDTDAPSPLVDVQRTCKRWAPPSLRQ